MKIKNESFAQILLTRSNLERLEQQIQKLYEAGTRK